MGLPDEEFLTVAEVAELLKLNQQTVRNWIDQGRLKAFRVGRRVRITRTDLEELLEKSRIQPPRPGQVFWDGDLPAVPVEPPDGG